MINKMSYDPIEEAEDEAWEEYFNVVADGYKPEEFIEEIRKRNELNGGY